MPAMIAPFITPMQQQPLNGTLTATGGENPTVYFVWEIMMLEKTIQLPVGTPDSNGVLGSGFSTNLTGLGWKSLLFQNRS